MQDYLDAKHPTLCADSDDGNSNGSGSNGGYLVEKTNCNSELKMGDLLNEEAGRDREGDNKKDAGEVTFID